MCLAVLALAAAWSSPALADDGVPDISIPAVPDLTEAATAVLEEAGLEELDPLTAVDPSIALPAVPAQKTAAEPATAGAVAAPPPEPAAESPVEAPPAVNPEPDAPPAPDVVQTAPTNVNISVRIDSPGDNGSVEQVNVAASTGGQAAAAPPAETAPQYQPDPAQYQQPIPASARLGSRFSASAARGRAGTACRRRELELELELRRSKPGHCPPAGGRDAELDVELGLELRRARSNTREYCWTKLVAVST